MAKRTDSAPDYYPMVEGLRLVYVSIDYHGDAPTVSRVVRVHGPVVANGAVRTMKVTVTEDDGPPGSYEVRRDQSGVWEDGVQVMKLPLKKGERWQTPESQHERYPIHTTGDASNKVRGVNPDQDEDTPGCLDIGFSDEDTGSGTRYYAPGLGFIREDLSDEEAGSVMILIDSQFPRDSEGAAGAGAAAAENKAESAG